MKDGKRILYASIVVGISLMIAGYLVSQIHVNAKKFDRYVTVKGLSEKEVDVDLAIWPIQITVVSNDLSRLQEDLQDQTRTVKNFFGKQLFTDTELTIGSPNIQDTRANFYGGNNIQNQFRYVARVDLTLRTTDIPKLQQAVAAIPSLIGEGIIIGSKGYYDNIEYLYTRLNEIKPGMIEEATINAREAAEKFARDSGSKVGKIKSANQGLFTIQNRDVNTSHIKKVRVVSTIEFYLED